MITIFESSVAVAEFAAVASLDSVRRLGHFPCPPGTRRFVGVKDGAVVAVSHLVFRQQWLVMDEAGSSMTDQGPVAYCFGTEVLEGCRGLGLGSRLYAVRLAAALDTGWPVGVEIMGTGIPSTVDDRALLGMYWHLSRGFTLVGCSVESDHGPALKRV